LTPFIEPGIEPLVSALNEIDFIGTVYSCEGHFDRPPNEKFLPTAYVTFSVGDITRFIPFHERLAESDRIEHETGIRMTYDCVLGRYTLSIWVGPSRREATQKRAAVDSAVARLSEMIRGLAKQVSACSPPIGVHEGQCPYPCREPVPPCTLVIPAREAACPFTGTSGKNIGIN